ncbi:MAG: hypothetical protein PW792_14340 [Acidobacteriaceae bacterium]|nr:hypothetical protein [Acidobacteriaceae bacterium]
MRIFAKEVWGLLLLLSTFCCSAQKAAQPQNPTSAVLKAFQTHDIVMIGEIHWDKLEWQWLDALVSDPRFADHVDDIVMEIGNSLYQKSVDRYVAGDPISTEDVQRAWRNTLGLGPPSPIYSELYRRVREVNMKRHGKHQIRILCGDPYIDWDKIETGEDIGPFLGHRDQWYAQVVKDEVIAKHHHALLIAGSNHFFREPTRPFLIERALQQTGAKTFVILAGTNAIGGYDDLDHRFDEWPVPSIATTHGNWVGDLPVLPVVTGGTATNYSPLELKDAADALLYLGPRDQQRGVHAPRAEVDETAYGKELMRRMSLLHFAPYIAEAHSDQQELPLFLRPAARKGSFSFPIPPGMDTPMPPRPPSE